MALSGQAESKLTFKMWLTIPTSAARSCVNFELQDRNTYGQIAGKLGRWHRLHLIVRFSFCSVLQFTGCDATSGRGSLETKGNWAEWVYGLWIPTLLWSLPLQRVLTTEYIDGCNVDDVDGLHRRGLEIADVSVLSMELLGTLVIHSRSLAP